MKIGIIGNGFVGKATYQLECKDIEINSYDINPDLCKPKGTKLIDLLSCEIIFISVPTPMNHDGSCYLNIVKSVMDDLKKINFENFVVLRSTVPVGTCDDLNCYFMPEFLTEKNFIDDFINNKNWYFGLLGNNKKDTEFKKLIIQLFDLAFNNKKINYNNLHFISNKEAELVKLFRNCFLSTKISFCNEINQFCNIKGIDYENVRKYAAIDDRIGLSHTNVPGHDGKNGFGGTCFPKDTSSLKYEMTKSGMIPYVMEAIIKRNELVDRPDKDWHNNEGRAVVKKKD